MGNCGSKSGSAAVKENEKDSKAANPQFKGDAEQKGEEK
jgi:hypothetical protein